MTTEEYATSNITNDFIDESEIFPTPNSAVMHKKPSKRIAYNQHITLKLTDSNDIIVKKESDIQISHAQPLLLEQKPTEPVVKLPVELLIERPSTPTKPIPPQIISMSPMIIPQSARKIERLPMLPTLPKVLIIERWLDYNERISQVRFIPVPEMEPLLKVKTTIIQWETPEIKLHREFKFEGVTSEVPGEYISRFGNDLLSTKNLPPEFVDKFDVPPGEKLGSHYLSDVPKLIGDIEALKLVDLEENDLSQYAHYVKY